MFRIQNDNVNTSSNQHGVTIHSAAASGNLEQLQSLLHNDVDVNTVDQSGKTALDFAAENGNVECVQYLLNYYGVEINYTREEIEQLPANITNILRTDCQESQVAKLNASY